MLTQNTIVQSKMLIDRFQADLNKNCDTITNYKNCVERNIREMQQKMKEDTSLVLSAINVSMNIIYSITFLSYTYYSSILIYTNCRMCI